MPEAELLRVAAYCRVSTDSRDQANSFENQKQYFMKEIRANPCWILQGIYADEGLSGTETRKRRQFLKLMAAAKAGEIDLILAKEVSRFARNTVDTLAYTRELRRCGVGVLFLLDNINTMDGDGELRLSIMATLAQEESRKISQRVKWGQTERMRQGVVFGPSLLGYQVKHGEIKVDPEGAQTVRAIYYKYLEEGKGSTVIARELCTEGVKSARGEIRWSAPTVVKILKNEKYCGDLRQKKTFTPDYLTHEKKYNRGEEEFITIRDHHPAIIPRETWERVQAELKRRRRGGALEHGSGSSLPLSGKLRCGVCGCALVSRRKRNAKGEVCRVWRCGRTAGGERCSLGHQLREKDLLCALQTAESMAAADCRRASQELLSLISLVLEGKQEKQEERNRLERELRQTEKKKIENLEAGVAGLLSRADMDVLNQHYNSRLAELKKRMEQTEESVHTGRTQEVLVGAEQVLLQALSGGKDPEFYIGLLDYAEFRQDMSIKIQLFGIETAYIFRISRMGEGRSDNVEKTTKTANFSTLIE